MYPFILSMCPLHISIYPFFLCVYPFHDLCNHSFDYIVHASICVPYSFANLCEEAYLTLRRRSPLLINLLAMMLQTGIPELRSMDDLNYVR